MSVCVRGSVSERTEGRLVSNAGSIAASLRLCPVHTNPPTRRRTPAPLTKRTCRCSRRPDAAGVDTGLPGVVVGWTNRARLRRACLLALASCPSFVPKKHLASALPSFLWGVWYETERAVSLER